MIHSNTPLENKNLNVYKLFTVLIFTQKEYARVKL